jgi:inward rectifier potassium channel
MKKEKDGLQAAEDSGFGKKFVGTSRLINSDGSFNIIRNGVTRDTLYEHMINVSWAKFFVEILLGFIAINLFFAFVYWLAGVQSINGKIQGEMQDFFNCFYFSIQTFTSVGYGFLSPQSNFANLIASFNAFIGLVGFALATGILFSRFSKARVNIMFSDKLIIAPFNGGKSLQFRVANGNNNTLMNMEVSVNMTWLEKEGDMMKRKFNRLKIELDFIYLFPLNWTIVHAINEDSPLWNKTKEEVIASNAEILIMIRGYDDTYNQHIFKNHSYQLKCLEENVMFEPMYFSENEKTQLYLDKISDIRRLD